jgi:transcriptional regulator with XRE-family HTH domain
MGGNDHTAAYRARMLRGLTIEQLAAKCGVTCGAISRIERGETQNPHKLTRRALAAALDYRVTDIWPSNSGKPHPDLRPVRRRRRAQGGSTPTNGGGKA